MTYVKETISILTNYLYETMMHTNTREFWIRC